MQKTVSSEAILLCGYEEEAVSHDNLILCLRKVGASSWERSWARSGQGWGKVLAKSGQKAKFVQGLGRQGVDSF